MTEPKFQIGDDLFVRNPGSFVEGATCIVGPVQAFSQMADGAWAYTMAADVGVPWGTEKPPAGQAMRFAERDLGLRTGTPLSQLSGRPGRPGYEQFKAIAASYGYD